MKESGTSFKMRISRKKNRDHEIEEKGLKNPIRPSIKRHFIRHHSTSSVSLSAWRFITVANCLADRNWTLGHHQIFAGNFEAWDTNKDGYVDTDEVRYVLVKDKGVLSPQFSMFDTHFGPKAQSKHPIEGSFCVTVIYTSFQLAWLPSVSRYDFHPLPDFHSFLNIFHIFLRKEGCSQAEVDHLFSSIVLPNITYALSVYGASESELTIAQQCLDRCFKRSYISKKLEIAELLKVQDHRICRKVSNIPNHPLRANFPQTKITRYNLRNKSPAMPAIHTDRFKNTFFNRIVFKYNVAL